MPSASPGTKVWLNLAAWGFGILATLMAITFKPSTRNDEAVAAPA
jgi:hypothetical protein